MKKSAFDPKSPLMPILAFCMPAGGIASLASTVGFLELSGRSADRTKKPLLTFAALLCAAVALIPGALVEDWLMAGLFLLLIPAAFLHIKPGKGKKALGFWLYAGLCVLLAGLSVARIVTAGDLLSVTPEHLQTYAALGTAIFRLDLARCVTGLVLLLSEKN